MRTGWGESQFPGFHVKYNHFLGMVYFKSKDVTKLPWTTTKDNVERESPLYQFALGKMRVAGKPALEFLNRLYAREIEVEGKEELELLQQAGSLSIEDVAQTKNAHFRATTKKVAKKEVTISYKKPLVDVEKAKAALGKRKLSNRAVGEMTFDYFMQAQALQESSSR